MRQPRRVRFFAGILVGFCGSVCLTFPVRAWTLQCLAYKAELVHHEVVEAVDDQGNAVVSPIGSFGWEQTVVFVAYPEGRVAINDAGPHLQFNPVDRAVLFEPVEQERSR